MLGGKGLTQRADLVMAGTGCALSLLFAWFSGWVTPSRGTEPRERTRSLHFVQLPEEGEKQSWKERDLPHQPSRQCPRFQALLCWPGEDTIYIPWARTGRALRAGQAYRLQQEHDGGPVGQGFFKHLLEALVPGSILETPSLCVGGRQDASLPCFQEELRQLET